MEASGYEPPAEHYDTQHDGTQHLAINDTVGRRYLALLALRTTALLYKRNGFCRPLTSSYIIKMGPFVHLTEAATMAFVAAKTSIPVPRVHCAFVHNNLAHIVMERISGESIASVWKSLSDADMKTILSQLRNILTELSAIQPPPGTGVQSYFHVWLREDFRPEDHPAHEVDQDWKDLREMKAMQDGPWPPPVFTHGDLNPSNILVRGDRVVGIIDWEFAGWYPHYWGYTSAWYGNRLLEQWQDRIPDFLDPHPEELRMEITRQRGWGDF